MEKHNPEERLFSLPGRKAFYIKGSERIPTARHGYCELIRTLRFHH